MRLLHVLRDAALDGPMNMARDEHLLYSDALRPAALRIYAWDPPTISLGYFQRFASLDALPAELRSLAVVRRPTGGGAILHDREVTYCLTADESLGAARAGPVHLYRLTHECWREALAEQGVTAELAPDDWPLPTPRGGPFFCFEKPGQTDLLLGGAKVLGSAQRRVGGRVLQHGSLILDRRFAAHPGANLGDPPREKIERCIERFVRLVAARLDLSAAPAEWDAATIADVDQRRARYASEEWLRKR
jgi:lipoate-protein ligase A